MRFRTLLGLVFCNLIWSANPMMGKLVLQDFAPLHAAWLRYASALLAYVIFAAITRSAPEWRARFGRAFMPLHGIGLRHLAILFLAGFMVFTFSPVLTMTGLNASQATDNALIVSMEPLITVVLAWLVLGERLGALSMVCFTAAIYGFTLLAGISWEMFRVGFTAHARGNLILLTALVGEGCYSVLSRKLLGRFTAHEVFGSLILAGVAFLSALMFFWQGLPELSRLSWGSALGILFLGPLGTTITYLYWMRALSEAPVASLALTLFVQPVAGACWGTFFLGEELSFDQWSGAILMLSAVFAQAKFTRPIASVSERIRPSF